MIDYDNNCCDDDHHHCLHIDIEQSQLFVVSSPSNSVIYSSDKGCPRYYTKSSTCYFDDIME